MDIVKNGLSSHLTKQLPADEKARVMAVLPLRAHAMRPREAQAIIEAAAAVLVTGAATPLMAQYCPHEE